MTVPSSFRIGQPQVTQSCALGLAYQQDDFSSFIASSSTEITSETSECEDAYCARSRRFAEKSHQSYLICFDPPSLAIAQDGDLSNTLSRFSK